VFVMCTVIIINCVDILCDVCVLVNRQHLTELYVFVMCTVVIIQVVPH